MWDMKVQQGVSLQVDNFSQLTDARGSIEEGTIHYNSTGKSSY